MTKTVVANYEVHVFNPSKQIKIKKNKNEDYYLLLPSHALIIVHDRNLVQIVPAISPEINLT